MSSATSYHCSMSSALSFILLSGGSSKRFGVDKSQALLAGVTLLNHVLAGLPETAKIFLVGPIPLNPLRSITSLREEPQFSGPVSAIATALRHISSDLVGVIATDMPLAPPVLLSLVGQLKENIDAIIPVDENERIQPLCAIYRTAALRHAIAALGSPVDRSMQDLLKTLSFKTVTLQEINSHLLQDVDTQEDMKRVSDLYKLITE